MRFGVLVGEGVLVGVDVNVAVAVGEGESVIVGMSVGVAVTGGVAELQAWKLKPIKITMNHWIRNRDLRMMTSLSVMK